MLKLIPPLPVRMRSLPNTEDTDGAHLSADTETPLAVTEDTAGTGDSPYMEVTGDMADTVPSVVGMDIPGMEGTGGIPASVSPESVDSGIPLTHLSETTTNPGHDEPAAPHGERPVHHGVVDDSSSPYIAQPGYVSAKPYHRVNKCWGASIGSSVSS